MVCKYADIIKLPDFFVTFLPEKCWKKCLTAFPLDMLVPGSHAKDKALLANICPEIFTRPANLLYS